MSPFRLAFAILAALAAVDTALAQSAPAPVAVARATIESVAPDGASLEAVTRAGEKKTVRLADKTAVTLVVPASLADVQPGAFIGVAALPGDGGTLKAMEVHVFPEAMRGTGEGHRPFDLAPGSTMTNGTIMGRLEAKDGAELTRRGLDPDDRVTITIEPDELIPGRRASRARVIAAGLTDDHIDRLIKRAQKEVEPPRVE